MFGSLYTLHQIDRLRLIGIGALRRRNRLSGNGSRDCPREVEAQFTEGDTQTVDDDAAYSQEPDDDEHGFGEMSRVCALDAIDGDVSKELAGYVEVEDGAYADGSKEAHEKGLSGFLDLVDFLVEEEDGREAAEEQDQDAEGDQAVDGNGVVVDELIPRGYGSEPDEDGYVEQHVYCWLKRVIQCFKTEPVTVY